MNDYTIAVIVDRFEEILREWGFRYHTLYVDLHDDCDPNVALAEAADPFCKGLVGQDYFDVLNECVVEYDARITARKGSR